ncbi:hypothetical protein G0Y24_11410 [Staphylococcus aureus]|nr:hypothetical protein [Staphylococcus aureus]
MKKFFFIGLLVFVVFFTAATIIWFSYDKNKYGTKQYDKTVLHLLWWEGKTSCFF